MSKKRGNQGRRRAGLVRQDYRGGGSVRNRKVYQSGGMAPEPGGPELPEYLTNEEDDQEGAPTSDPSSGQGSTPTPGDSNVPNTENTGNISDAAAAAIANQTDPQEGSGPPDDESFVVGDPGGPGAQGEVGGGSSSGTPAGTAAFAQNGQETGVDPADDNQSNQGSSYLGTDPAIVDQEVRAARIAATGDTVSGAALAGDVGAVAPDAVLPDAVEVDSTIEADTIAMTGSYDATATTAGAVTEADTVVGATTLGVTPDKPDVATMTADLIANSPEIDPAQLEELSEGAIAKVTEIRELSGPAVAAKITDQAVKSAKAETLEGALSEGALVPEVVGVGGQISDTPQAEAKAREAITGVAATGTAAKIVDTVGYDASTRSAVKGTARTGAAATMLAEVGDMPPDITAAIVQDPAKVEAMLDNEPVEVQAAVAALPEEALVSSQMESLVGGMESGDPPAWARPAIDAVNNMMKARGLSMSSVGRDSLFNAVITQAMPMAQSNAKALQARAAQNLSHEQQANVEGARLDMTRRMANLSNRQTSESQSAQMSQQMKVMQSQFDQQAVMTSAQQQQQTRTQNLQNRQRSAEINVANEQAMAAQNLGNEQQIEMANLEIENQVGRENMSAQNQEKLAEMQIAASFLSQNAGFQQEMNKANLSTDQQMRLANLTAQNQADSESLSNAQNTEFANLNATMQVNTMNAQLANQMGIAQLNVDQQRAVQNAMTVANMDMANFSAAQQTELANSKWMQTSSLANLSNEQQAVMQNATAMASLDLATVDQRTRIAAQNAQAFLTMDMTNLSYEQQGVILGAQQEQQRLLSNQSATNASRQFNATSENQMNQFMTGLSANMEQFNASQSNQMEMFNANSENARSARAAGREADREKFNAQLVTGIDQFNTQIDFQRDNWNAANAQAVEQSNTQWRRQANTINTAAQNRVNAQNAMNSFNMSSRSMGFLWQELRDQADYDFKSRENERQRKAALTMAALGNEGAAFEGNEGWSSRLQAALQIASSAFGATSNTGFQDSGTDSDNNDDGPASDPRAG